MKLHVVIHQYGCHANIEAPSVYSSGQTRCYSQHDLGLFLVFTEYKNYMHRLKGGKRLQNMLM